MRIDAHLHFWRPACGFDNRPVADHAAYRRDFLPGDVAPDLARTGVNAVILVQTAPQVAETAWLLGLAEARDDIIGVTGWADLDTDALDFGLVLDHPKIVGLRAQLRRIADDRYVLRPRVIGNLQRALEHGLGITMLAEPRHYAVMPDALAQLPPGPIVFNHLGMPGPRTDRAQWSAALQAFARRPQTFLQLSGLPFLFGDAWQQPDALSLLDEAFDIFGPHRLLFASDWPMLLRFARYEQWVGCVEALLQRRGCSPTENSAVFGGNAADSLPRLQRRLPPNPSPRTTALEKSS